MNISKLTGHSGCDISLVEDDDGFVFVRKKSSSIDYNERLLVQCDKQKTFKSKALKTPKIFNQGYDDSGLFYFDMEFIRGMTLSEFLTNADISTIGPIVKVFVHHFISENCFSTISSSKTQSIFIQKAKSTYSKITSPSKIVSNSMEVVLSHNWSFYQKTSCHGDLTFENIMVVNGDVYLIDFLDSFFDSSIIDLSKMLQDLQCEWSFRNSQVDNNTIVRLLIFKELLLSSIKSINPSIIKEAYYSLLLTLIRIYPYTNDERTMEFLDNKLSIALNKVKEFEK